MNSKIWIRASLVLSMGTGVAFAQLNFPVPSPEARLRERVGFTRIEIRYERPSARGRKVFGELVPMKELWRTGAGEATTVRFSEDVSLAGNKLPQGSYSLFSIPEEGGWTIIFNKDTTLHGTGSYTAENDALRFRVVPGRTHRFYETFTIEIGDRIKNNAALCLSWENTQVSIPLVTNADATIMAEIRGKITDGKKEEPLLLYQAANYYYEHDKDLIQAMEWLNKAIGKDEKFIYHHLKAKIQAKQGNFKAAIASARQSSALAKKDKMGDFVKTNDALIAEWSKKQTQ